MQKYRVTGMSCAACQARVEKAVAKVPGVESVAVSLLTNSMGVEGTADPSQIITAVERAGYGALPAGAGTGGAASGSNTAGKSQNAGGGTDSAAGGTDSAAGGYTGAAYQGVELLPRLAEKINFVFQFLFGFTDSHQIAFPITALGAVGAALGLVPNFMQQGWIDGNAIAVFTAIGMCWSGYLSTHTAMLDSLGYRELTPKAIISHTIGGLVAAIVALVGTGVFLKLFGMKANKEKRFED